MRSKSDRKIFRQLVEGFVAIALVLLFFFIIMSVLNLFFPSGGGFSLFMNRQEIAQVNESIKRQHDLRLSRNGESSGVSASGEWAARLTTTRNVVKSKRAIDIAWQNAETGMTLFDQDAVQTLDQSTALIHFDDQNEIELGENSLIVIKRMEQDLIFKEKRSYMVVVDGELRGRIGGAKDDGVFLEVTTPNAVTRLQNTAKSDTPLEFRINVEEDSASTITLYSGEAEVEAQGLTVFLKQDQMTRVIGSTAPSTPIAVPKQIQQETPVNDRLFAYRSLPPRVRLTWKSAIDMTGYHLQLARDRQFREVVLDERVNENWFTHGNLHAGDYFWKVAGIQGEIEGPFSPARHFTLMQDDQPPKLEVHFPVRPSTTATIELTGQSEPNSQIFIAGQKIVSSSTGEFHYVLPISRGMNVVVVEAIDQAGNISYSSEIINGLY